MPIRRSSALNSAGVFSKYMAVAEQRQSKTSGLKNARPKQTAHLLSRWAVVSPSGLMGALRLRRQPLKIYPI
jgi:hypothetical protein